jgi:hypothetical protein
MYIPFSIAAKCNPQMLELGWESLAERRQRRKLQMFYNIQNNNAPMHLCDLIPPTIQSTTGK